MARNGSLSRTFQIDEMPTEVTNYLKRNVKQSKFIIEKKLSKIMGAAVVGIEKNIDYWQQFREFLLDNN